MDSKIIGKFRDFFLVFIILQPVLDILTTFSLKYFDTSITIGIVTRVLFMGIALLFILFSPGSTKKKWIITYLSVLFLVIAIGVINNIFSKPIFSLFSEAQFLTKALYYPIVFSFIILLFDFTKERKKEKVLVSIAIASLIISLSVFIAVLTGTSGNTYPYLKSGFKGWFNAGNELGAIIAISFPLLLLYAKSKTINYQKMYYWIPILFLGITGLLVGTKVSYFSVILSTIIFITSLVLEWVFKRKEQSKQVLTNLVLSLIFLGFYFVATPFSPSYQNISSDAERLPIEEGKIEIPSVNEETEELEEEEKEIIKEETRDFGKVLNVILSSRNIYFSMFVDYYSKAEFMQKTFGMGYAGNYEDKPKLVEMDFFDFFFSFGIVGFVLLMLPFIYLVVLLITDLFRNFKETLNSENIMLLTSLTLGIGIAFLAGHVLSAPAVSIYLTLTMALLLFSLSKRERVK